MKGEICGVNLSINAMAAAFFLLVNSSSYVAAFSSISQMISTTTVSSTSQYFINQQQQFSVVTEPPSLPPLNRSVHQRTTTTSTRLCASNTDGSSQTITEEGGQANVDGAKYYPALSEEEIKEIMDAIPVYAVTNQDDGIVLLKEKDKKKSFATTIDRTAREESVFPAALYLVLNFHFLHHV